MLLYLWRLCMPAFYWSPLLAMMAFSVFGSTMSAWARYWNMAGKVLVCILDVLQPKYLLENVWNEGKYLILNTWKTCT